MAEKRQITKKIISKVMTTEAPVQEAVVEEKKEVIESVDSEKILKTKRSCFFCQGKLNPTYTDLVILKKYLTDRAKIVPKLRSSVCSRHQRAVCRHIKYARHLSLFPFVPKV